MKSLNVAVIGGGASGCFCAINIKEAVPQADVAVYEAAAQPLRKLGMTGGGRCNITNTFASVCDLRAVYPRGHHLLKKLFHEFGHEDAMEWFGRRGVALYAQDDGRVFPVSDSAQEVCSALSKMLNRLGVRILTGRKVDAVDLDDGGRFAVRCSDGGADGGFDAVVVATGGWHKDALYESLQSLGVDFVPPVPSLFSLKIKSNRLTSLMGASVDNAAVMVPGQKFRGEGGLIVTHFGLSGPAVLKLSSYAARHLADCNYKCDLVVNWLGMADDAVRDAVAGISAANPRKAISAVHPVGLTQRLWEYLVGRAEIGPATKCCELGKKNLNRLVSVLAADLYHVSGRGQFGEEFVTCGGVALGGVNSKTLESKNVRNLYFTGEALDIDAITGGFNLQGCWTTGWAVAKSIGQWPWI